ncbi:hypothetical protein NMG60_11031231 [Bertholletia excelsa]
MVVHLQRIWNFVTGRFGIRKTGLVKLRHDVRTCEYEDVHVLWEMLQRNGSEVKTSSGASKKRFSWNFTNWTRRAPYLCSRV